MSTLADLLSTDGGVQLAGWLVLIGWLIGFVAGLGFAQKAKRDRKRAEMYLDDATLLIGELMAQHKRIARQLVLEHKVDATRRQGVV